MVKYLSRGMRVIKYKDKGRQVIELQRLLNLAIDAKLKVDGVFGKATLKAVKDFQRQNKLVVDGIVGEKTWKVLNVKAKANALKKVTIKPAPATTTPPPKPKPKIHVVLDVQHLNKKSNPKDVGAVYRELTEGHFNLRVAQRVKELLSQEFKITILSPEKPLDYYERHNWVNSQPDVKLYLAMHLNSTAKPLKNYYSLFGYNYKRPSDKDVITKDIFPPTRQVYIKRYFPLMRGYSCIKGVKAAPAILCEPYFIQELTINDVERVAKDYVRLIKFATTRSLS